MYSHNMCLPMSEKQLKAEILYQKIKKCDKECGEEAQFEAFFKVLVEHKRAQQTTAVEYKSMAVTTDKKAKNSINKKNEKECCLEFVAFARGGIAGLYVLNRVWKNILVQFEVPEERFTNTLWSAGLFIDGRNGKIERFKPP